MIEQLLDKIVPSHVKQLEPYQSARRIGGSGRIWLNANELEDGIEYAQDDAAVSTVNANRYPDFLPHDLAADYLAYCAQVTPSFSAKSDDLQAVAVRGADEAIDLLVRSFCYPNQDAVMICPPTYGMYEFCADASALQTVKVALDHEFQLDLEPMLAQLDAVNLVFLCSPNNPTGNVIKRESIETLLQASQDKALVVVDEAYIEFAPSETVLDLMATYPNLVVIRTLSKAFGLASARCGFLIASSAVMDVVAKVIPPYPMADVVAQMAQSALSKPGVEIMQKKTQALIDIREQFMTELNRLEHVVKVYPSATNFVLIEFLPNTHLHQYLLKQGIVTRNQAHELALKNCVRISIGNAQSMQETLMAIKSYTQDLVLDI